MQDIASKIKNKRNNMKNLKYDLFNFKKDLPIEEHELSIIAERYIRDYDKFSEKELVSSLKESLSPLMWDNKVVKLVESFEDEIKSDPLNYNLKDLYKKIERKNYGQMYRPALSSILNIINLEDTDSKMSSIVNELVIHDWIPEVKMFLDGYMNNPIQRQNLRNSGKASKVFTLVEKVEDGNLVFMKDRWFLINQDEVKQTLVENHIKDIEKVREFRILEKVMTIGDIKEDSISFRLDENLTLSISTKNDKEVFLNEEKLDKETTLENLFQSKIIPWLKKDYYVLSTTTANNIDKFVDLDIALKVENTLYPYLECYVINYNDKMYVYNCDARTGTAFYEYNSANDIINDVQKELDYDLSKFLDNKLSKEVKHLKALEDKEMEIKEAIKEIDESLALLKENENLLNEDENLKKAFENLLISKHELYKNLGTIKSDKVKAKRMII
ncbi:hypothetical protein M0Q97_02745 [Candidatus Dojkabacteria bacterium]|jgi:hypothetical protein|nr:hypothetical protein [Candidatus Dojkabacteria bacterium]